MKLPTRFITDSRIFFRRPDLSCYAVLSKPRYELLRKRGKLDAWLKKQKRSGVIIPTDAIDDPHRDKFDATLDTEGRDNG